MALLAAPHERLEEYWMSVWNKRIGGLLVASIVVAAVAGCGGNTGGIPNSPTNNVVSVDGGVHAQGAVSNTSLSAESDSRVIEVTPAGSGTPIQAIVPPGIAVNSGDQLAIVPADVLLLNGLEGGANRDPGDIKINGRLVPNLHIVQGRLNHALALPAGHYDLEASGPFSVRNGAAQLTIQQFIFHFNCDGRRLSLPVGLEGDIPSNGSNNWTNSVTATFTNPYIGGTATLKITHLNGVLQRTVDVVNGTATFTDFQNDPQSQIPSQGVTTVEFSH